MTALGALDAMAAEAPRHGAAHRAAAAASPASPSTAFRSTSSRKRPLPRPGGAGAAHRGARRQRLAEPLKARLTALADCSRSDRPLPPSASRTAPFAARRPPAREWSCDGGVDLTSAALADYIEAALQRYIRRRPAGAPAMTTTGA